MGSRNPARLSGPEVSLAFDPMLHRVRILKSLVEGRTRFPSSTLDHFKAPTEEKQGRFDGEGRPGEVTAHVLWPPGE